METSQDRIDSAIAEGEVRSALEGVLASSVLQRSPQLQRLLRYLVEETLAGHGDRLKEYVLGVEIFGRPASYDPRLDSLVRVEARRLRGTLETYYRSDGVCDPIVIELQKGSYVPSFRLRERDAAPSKIRDTAVGHRGSRHVRMRAFGENVRRALAKSSRFVLVLAAVAAAIGIVVALLSTRTRPAQALSERDSIVLGEFVNSTGDRVFDDALKQGLTIELEQSPFLNLVSDKRVGDVLKLTGRSAGARLNQELAREVCLRTESKAAVSASITRIGTQYVIALTATDCNTGDALAHVQADTDRKEGVLKALSTAALTMRARLGESLSSIQKFDVPIEDATTSSLDALEAYSLGRRMARERGSPSDIPFYLRAIELDHNFAVAHAALAVSYVNLGQPTLATEYLRRAYELRDRVSEREKCRISAYYYHAGTGELEKAIEMYELWKRSYPRDFAPYINLGLAYTWLGQYEKAVSETEQALQLEPNNVLAYSNLAAHYIKLDRLEEADAVLQQASSRNLTSRFMRQNLGMLAFLRGDAATMEQQLVDVKGTTSGEDALLSQQSDTEAYYGRLKMAREYSRRAVDSAKRAGNKEAAAGWLINEALREAEFGNAPTARNEILEALQLAPGRDVVALAALALARSGDVHGAEVLLRHVQKDYPLNTIIGIYWAPTTQAAVQIRHGNPARALEFLQRTAPYELGSPPPMGLATLYPIYLRGEAYLLARRSDAAAVEAQKILDHPGLGLNFPLHALAQLQLARARAQAGDRAGALRAYEGFLGLWKGADSDIPILQRARFEDARLK